MDWQLLTRAITEACLVLIAALPRIVVAGLVVAIGFFVADRIGRLVARLLHKFYFDQALDNSGLSRASQLTGLRFRASGALGTLLSWLLGLIVLVVAAEILHLDQVSAFLESIVVYLPNVIVALLILACSIIVSKFIFTLIEETALSANIPSATVLARLGQWAVIVFAIMAALVQLQVATQLIKIIFAGIIFMVSLAGGIAFGFGGRDKAKELIDSLSKKN